MVELSEIVEDLLILPVRVDAEDPVGLFSELPASRPGGKLGLVQFSTAEIPEPHPHLLPLLRLLQENQRLTVPTTDGQDTSPLIGRDLTRLRRPVFLWQDHLLIGSCYAAEGKVLKLPIPRVGRIGIR